MTAESSYTGTLHWDAPFPAKIAPSHEVILEGNPSNTCSGIAHAITAWQRTASGVNEPFKFNSWRFLLGAI